MKGLLRLGFKSAADGDAGGGFGDLMNGPLAIILAAVGLFVMLALAAYVWFRVIKRKEPSLATGSRKGSRRRRRRRSSRPSEVGGEAPASREATPERASRNGEGSKGRHAQRPAEVTRSFPSLAESGGLPPVRTRAEVDPPPGP